MPGHGDAFDLPTRQFVQAVAAKTPTPGGGSVAGLVGGLAAALGEMSLAFTRGRKKYAQHEAYYDHLSQRLTRARTAFDALAADDIAAFEIYQQAHAREDSPGKAEAVQTAVAGIVDVPREMAKLALAVLEDLAEFRDKCVSYLMSDLLAGAALAAAVVRICDYNVRVNVAMFADAAAGDQVRQSSQNDVIRAQTLLNELERAAFV